jgi:hypothetical protein
MMGAKAKAMKGGLQAARATPGKRSSAKGAAKLGGRSAKVGARTARRSPSLQALLHDERVHDRLWSGLGALEAVYRRVSRRGNGAEALVDDRKTRRELKRAIVSFKEARNRVRKAKVKKRRRVAAGPLIAVGAVVALAALAISEKLRQKAFSLLFGNERATERRDAGPATNPAAPAAGPSTSS